MFGGFILHFLLSNYLTVLLTPKYEEPVETAADLIKRDITPFLWPGGEIFKQLFAASSDPVYQEISRRIVIANDWDDYEDMVRKVTSTGLFAQIGTTPWYFISTDEWIDWYKSSETIAGDFPYSVHLANKKWPLKKVKFHKEKHFNIAFHFQKYDLTILRFTQVSLVRYSLSRFTFYILIGWPSHVYQRVC